MKPAFSLKQSAWTLFKDYFLITLGLLLYTGGWTLFLMPHQLVGGGVTGIGVIIEYATAGLIPVSLTYLVLNVILLIAAFFILGKGFGTKTIYGILLASFLFAVLGKIPGLEVITTDLALQNGKMMSVVFGGIMAGLGIGISISAGGSTGGTDIVALIYTKFRNVSPGKVILTLDLFIICSSFIFVPTLDAEGAVMPFSQAWPEKTIVIVYGLVLVFITSYVLDFYLSGANQSIQLFILSKKSDEIADAITSGLHRGVTVLDGMGWYTKEPTKVLMVMSRKTDLNVLLRYVKTIDPAAFLSVSSVSGVYGKGFDVIKSEAKVLK